MFQELTPSVFFSFLIAPSFWEAGLPSTPFSNGSKSVVQVPRSTLIEPIIDLVDNVQDNIIEATKNCLEEN